MKPGWEKAFGPALRIEGGRIFLRPLGPADVGAEYLAWMNDPEVTRFLEVRFRPQTLAGIREFVASLQGDVRNQLFGIFLKEDGRHIGNIKLGALDPNHSTADLGLLIGAKDCWNRGFATEAIALATAYAFRDLGIHKIVAGFYAANAGSMKAFAKAGYAEEARLKGQLVSGGGRDDQALMGKTNPERET